jgi:hypothetical protein
MYDLFVAGVNAFFERRPGAKRLVRREPLSGLADGSNTVFLTAHHPFLYSTFAAYLYNAAQPAGAFSAIDADGGVVQFNAAPLVQPVADYTVVPLTNRQIIYFTMAGFDWLETLWQRGFALSSSAAAYVRATADDDHAYIVTSPGTFTDPTCGSLYFSTSKIQQALLSRCIEMAYLDALAYEAAAVDINIRERLGGISIDASARPKNLLAMKNAVMMDVRRTLYAAMDEYYPNGEHYADKLTPTHTDEYNNIWHWQSDADGTIFPTWLNL